HFEPPRQPLFIFFEHFDVIIQKADATHPYGRNQQQYYIYIGEFPKQEGRNDDGCQDDEPAHGGCTLLRQLTFQPQIPDALAYLFSAQHIYELAAEDDGDEQRKQGSHPGPERNILEYTRTGKIKLFV